MPAFLLFFFSVSKGKFCSVRVEIYLTVKMIVIFFRGKVSNVSQFLRFMLSDETKKNVQNSYGYDSAAEETNGLKKQLREW